MQKKFKYHSFRAGRVISLLLVSVLLGCKIQSESPGSGDSCPRTLPENMSCIPGGEFILGSEQTDWKNENWDLFAFKKHTVILSAFLMDKTEVTTEEYQSCVTKKKCEPQQSNYPHLREPGQPQLKVTWYQAKAYCEAQGKRLPTEAEFEAASRGPHGDPYPWGKENPDCTRVVFKDSSGRGCQGNPGPGYHKAPPALEATGSTWDVASKPAGHYGLYDMSGNAQEWVSDWFVETLEECGNNCIGKDPQGPCPGEKSCQIAKEKIVKGGSWYWGDIAVRSASRRPHFPQNEPTHHFGFRCAKSVSRE